MVHEASQMLFSPRCPSHPAQSLCCSPQQTPFCTPQEAEIPPPLASLCEVSGGSGGSAHAFLRAHPALPPLRLAPLAHPLVPIGNGNHPILWPSLTPNVGTPTIVDTLCTQLHVFKKNKTKQKNCFSLLLPFSPPFFPLVILFLKSFSIWFLIFILFYVILCSFLLLRYFYFLLLLFVILLLFFYSFQF